MEAPRRLAGTPFVSYARRHGKRSPRVRGSQPATRQANCRPASYARRSRADIGRSRGARAARPVPNPRPERRLHLLLRRGDGPRQTPLDRRRDRRATTVTEYTRPATWEDVKTLARHLEEEGVEYALVGGYALAAYGFNRFTEDIDILVNPAAENSQRWILALSRLPDGAAKELAAESDVFADDQRYAIRINDEFTVDVMPSIAGLSWDDMKQHVVPTK